MNITITYGFPDAPLSEALQHLMIPRKTRHFLRTRKDVLINGESHPFHTLVKTGDQLTLKFHQDDYPAYHVIPSYRPVGVVYEDEHLIIVNKPIHQKTHPNEPTESHTLLNDVMGYLEQKGAQTHHFMAQPYVVHRLDKETSGLVLFAKNPVILPLLTQMLEQKNIHRDYEAIATGLIHHAQTIDKPIGRSRHDKRKRQIDAHGKRAITHLHVINHQDGNTRIRCTLETGRTHQIRVHLASIGHPLLGDPLYNKKATNTKRLYLHAYRLHFIHPLTFETIDVTSPVPF